MKVILLYYASVPFCIRLFSIIGSKIDNFKTDFLILRPPTVIKNHLYSMVISYSMCLSLCFPADSVLNMFVSPSFFYAMGIQRCARIQQCALYAFLTFLTRVNKTSDLVQALGWGQGSGAAVELIPLLCVELNTPPGPQVRVMWVITPGPPGKGLYWPNECPVDPLFLSRGRAEDPGLTQACAAGQIYERLFPSHALGPHKSGVREGHEATRPWLCRICMWGISPPPLRLIASSFQLQFCECPSWAVFNLPLCIAALFAQHSQALDLSDNACTEAVFLFFPFRAVLVLGGMVVCVSLWSFISSLPSCEVKACVIFVCKQTSDSRAQATLLSQRDHLLATPYLPQVEKIKTIGDAYMAAAIPLEASLENIRKAVTAVINLSIAMQKKTLVFLSYHKGLSLSSVWQVRQHKATNPRPYMDVQVAPLLMWPVCNNTLLESGVHLDLQRVLPSSSLCASSREFSTPPTPTPSLCNSYTLAIPREGVQEPSP